MPDERIQALRRHAEEAKAALRSMTINFGSDSGHAYKVEVRSTGITIFAPGLLCRKESHPESGTGLEVNDKSAIELRDLLTKLYPTWQDGEFSDETGAAPGDADRSADAPATDE